MSDIRIQEGREHHRRGDYPRAIAAYEAVLSQAPALADVWHLKAAAERQSGRLAEARESVRQALLSGGEQPPYLLLEGSILYELRELGEAERRFARALELKPGLALAHVELGRVQLDQGRPTEALASFREAVRLDGRNLRAWNNLGAALQVLDRLDEAIRAFDYALTIDPSYPMAHFNLARIYKLRQEIPRALEHALNAVRADPSNAEAWLLIGDLHSQRRETVQALAAYASAVKAAPEALRPRLALADGIAGAGGYAEAKAESSRAAAQFPGSLRAALRANLLLPQVYAGGEQVDPVRAQYIAGLGRLEESRDRFVDTLGAAALSDAVWTNFYLAYQGREDVDLQRRYGQFLRSVLQRAVPQFYAPRPRREPQGRIRVGFLSHFFFNCTAGRYFASWITRLDPERFETFVYYTNPWVAEDTRVIAAAAAHYRHLPGRPLHTLAQEVLADALDVLVYPELGMHPDTFTLASLRLAPVQCAGWGHPQTTGHPEIDWFISCEDMEPEGAERHYSERLALLPGLGTRYATPSTDSTRTRADFELPEDRTLYLVPQSLFKIHPDNDDIIARVLAGDARGVAVIFASHLPNLTTAFATRLAAAFERHGLDIHERTRFLAPFQPHGEYLRLNQLCDVMLDTVHWSGGNTSLDALASGLPVVTLPGSLMRGRQSQAMLKALGVGELIAASLDEYVSVAVRLGTDAEYRTGISQRIRANLGNLFERDEPVRALEDFLGRAVRGAGG